MKREGRLIERITDLDNLYLAYWKAQRGKANRAEVKEYSEGLQERLLLLGKELGSGNIAVGEYRYVTIHDPKERKISVSPFKDRVMQHAIMNVCHDGFERYQVPQSYASRIGKGTYAAIEKARDNQKKWAWYLKMDMRKYFDSIDHSVLKEMLRRRFKDRVLLQVFDKIIESYSVVEGKGLPIGNLASQYFANHYLTAGDRFLTEKLRKGNFVRYMDDVVVWGDTKEELKDIRDKYKAFVEDNLKLLVKPEALNRVEKGLNFCGYRLFPDKTLLTKVSKHRFETKAKVYNIKLQRGEWSEQDYVAHIVPLLAFTQKAGCRGLRKKVFYSLNKRSD